MAACSGSSVPDSGCSMPVCNGICCGNGTICVQDQAGKLSCAATCSDPGVCTPAAPCCTPLGDRDGGLMQTGVCFPTPDPDAGIAYACICVTPSQCPSGCCAPHVDGQGLPVGPLVCKSLDGLSYACCSGGPDGTHCRSASDCCFGDSAGNHYCSTPCAHDSSCGGARCLTFADTSLTNCIGKMGCGPP